LDFPLPFIRRFYTTIVIYLMQQACLIHLLSMAHGDPWDTDKLREIVLLLTLDNQGRNANHFAQFASDT
jgi:hypothetical protein